MILSNNKCSFNYREYISLKNNPSYVKNVVGLFGVCIYSIFFANSLNASTYTWECKKNRSYLIKERQFVDAKDRIKVFPTKFLSNLDEQSKVINLTYSLGTGNATINGIAGRVYGFSEVKKNLKKFPNIPLTIVIVSDEFINLEENKEETNLVDKDGKEKLVKTEVRTNSESATNNFILKFQNKQAKFVSNELTDIATDQYTLKENDVYSNETLDLKKLIEVSTGECRLLEKKIN